MKFIIRYAQENQVEIEDPTLAGAEMRARSMALTHKLTLLSISPVDDPKPMPGPGTWKIPTFGLRK